MLGLARIHEPRNRQPAQRAIVAQQRGQRARGRRVDGDGGALKVEVCQGWVRGSGGEKRAQRRIVEAIRTATDAEARERRVALSTISALFDKKH